MAQQYGFFQYLRLKLIAVLRRVRVWLSSFNATRRDKALIPPDIESERIKIPSCDPAAEHIFADLYYPTEFPPSTSPPLLLNLLNDCYAPEVDSQADPAVSPAFAVPHDFPPTATLLSYAGDPLWPEANALANMEAAGVEVVSPVFEGVPLPHVFDKGAGDDAVAWKRRREEYGWMAAFI